VRKYGSGDHSALGLNVPSLWFERGTETEEWKEDSGRVGPPGSGSDLRAQGEDLLSRQHREEVREHIRPGLRQRGHHADEDASGLYRPPNMC